MPAGFDRQVWEGEKPLVEPAVEVIEVGSIVWERAPEDSSFEKRGGIVINAKTSEDGERTLTILRASKRGGKFTVHTFDLDASSVDRAMVERRSPHRMHRAARQICRALGESQNVTVAGFDRYLLEVAVGLVVMAEDDVRAVAEKLRAS
jgi:hypothetical protein